MRLRPDGAAMTARGRHAPVTLGSPRFRHIHAPSIDVVAAWFPPHGQLESHTHARAVFGVMLDGDFRTRILRRDVNYLASGAWTEPAEERHANAAGDRGAHVVVLQPSVSDTELAHECRRLLDEVVYLQSAELRADAARLAAECAVQDDLSPLVAEGSALAMLARAARLYRSRLHRDHAPRWLTTAVDYLHAHHRERIDLGGLARSVGVHPSRLAHEFRARLGASPGEYVRRLRLEWAAAQLSDGESSVAEVALRAGFYDQSHFSRMFRRHFGIAPAAWRRSRE